MTDEAVEKLVAELVRPEVRALAAYHVPDPGDMVKLDAMENPYPWPGELAEQWLARLRGVLVNRYPDPRAGPLRLRLREVMRVPDGCEILLGNGSDELIQLILLALGRPRAVVLAPEPTFVMYKLLALALGLRYVGVPLNEVDFSLDLPAMLGAIAEHRPAVVFLAYPNNPTGSLFPAADMQRIVAAAPGLVVVDEAYTPFARESFLPAAPEHPNLVVLRTVSKMGLAGLRLGWLAGAAAWVRELDKLRLPYNINTLTQASADFALAHWEVLETQAGRIREDREALGAELAGIEGVQPWPSRANFILFRVPPGRAGEIFMSLRRQGVLIKNLDGSAPLLRDCLRVTVGAPEENAAFLQALRTALHA